MITLDEIAAAPERAAELSSAERQKVTLAVAAILAAIAAAPVEIAKALAAVDEDKLLGVEQAAEMLGLIAYWVRRHARELPFALRIGRGWRFSRSGIERYIRQREGKR
jgi:hypothetical protein